jgi:uncharacterized protein (DUF983 family)
MSAAETSPLKTALWRGFLGRCPHCGRDGIFRAFLKVVDHCPACGEEFFHHRADDLPAYLVMVIVGHLIVGTLLFVEAARLLGYWAELAIFLPLALILSVALLQPVKGAVVALQWCLGMHGFARQKLARIAQRQID